MGWRQVGAQRPLIREKRVSDMGSELPVIIRAPVSLIGSRYIATLVVERSGPRRRKSVAATLVWHRAIFGYNGPWFIFHYKVEAVGERSIGSHLKTPRYISQIYSAMRNRYILLTVAGVKNG